MSPDVRQAQSLAIDIRSLPQRNFKFQQKVRSGVARRPAYTKYSRCRTAPCYKQFLHVKGKVRSGVARRPAYTKYSHCRTAPCYNKITDLAETNSRRPFRNTFSTNQFSAPLSYLKQEPFLAPIFRGSCRATARLRWNAGDHDTTISDISGFVSGPTREKA